MKKFISLALLALILVPGSLALAQTQAGPNVPRIPDPSETAVGTNVGGVIGLICTIFNYAFFALLLAAVGFVLLAAYRYLTAAGNPDGVKTANKTLILAAVAVAVALLARAVPVIVGNFFVTNSGGDGFNVCTGS